MYKGTELCHNELVRWLTQREAEKGDRKMTTYKTTTNDAATNERVLALTLTDIDKAYSGRPSASGNHCRCGCRGKYSYNPLLADNFIGSSVDRGYPLDAKDLSLAGIKRALKEIKTYVTSGGCATVEDDYVDVELPSGRCYTAYLVKK